MLEGSMKYEMCNRRKSKNDQKYTHISYTQTFTHIHIYAGNDGDRQKSIILLALPDSITNTPKITIKFHKSDHIFTWRAKTRQIAFLSACFMASWRPSRSWRWTINSMTGRCNVWPPFLFSTADMSRFMAADGCLRSETPPSKRKEKKKKKHASPFIIMKIVMNLITLLLDYPSSCNVVSKGDTTAIFGPNEWPQWRSHHN